MLIEGSGAEVSVEPGQLTLTGLTQTVVGSVKFPDMPGGEWLDVTGELDIERAFTWSSSGADLWGTGTVVTGPGSTTDFGPGTETNLAVGQFVNEGTTNWDSGLLAVLSGPGLTRRTSSTFFVNLGTFNIDAPESHAILYGCQWEGGGASCPIFENDGTFTATPTDSGGNPHIEWGAIIKNYGRLEVPHMQEEPCPWEFSEYPGPGTEACMRANETFEGLLMQDDAYVEEPSWNVSPPRIEGFAEEGDALTATTGVWATPHATFNYQWQRCDSVDEAITEEEWLTEPPPRECNDIPGATTSSYQVTSDDLGYRLRAVVSAHTAVRSESVASEATAPVYPEELFGEEGTEEEIEETEAQEGAEGTSSFEEFIPEEGGGNQAFRFVSLAFLSGEGGESDAFTHYTPSSPRYKKIGYDAISQLPDGEWGNEAAFNNNSPRLRWSYKLSPLRVSQAVDLPVEKAFVYKLPSKKVINYSDFHAEEPAWYLYHSTVYVQLKQEYQLAVNFAYACYSDGRAGECKLYVRHNFKLDD